MDHLDLRVLSCPLADLGNLPTRGASTVVAKANEYSSIYYPLPRTDLYGPVKSIYGTMTILAIISQR